MMAKRLIPILLGCLLLAVAPLGAGAIEPVGEVQLVKIWAYERQPPSDWGDLLFRDSIFMEQWLRTVDDGALHVRFVDGTRLRMGANSEAVIDRYIYDPARGKGELGVRLGRGMFRFITGAMNKRGVRIETPTAWIGVRGTNFIVHVGAAVIVHVISGIAIVTPKAPGGSATSVGPGQTVAVGPGQATASPAAEPALDYGLASDGGIDTSGGGNGGEGSGGGGGGGGGNGGEGGGS